MHTQNAVKFPDLYVTFIFVDSITAAIVTPVTVFVIAVIATVVVLWLRRRHNFKCLNLSLMRTVDNDPDYDTVTEQRFNLLWLLLFFFLFCFVPK